MTVQPWATVADATACGQCATEPPPASLERWLAFASNVLYRLSGSKWPGEQDDIIRPNKRGCGCHPSRPSCGRLSEIELDGFPVVEVVEVLIDGEEVPEDHWRVDDSRWLVWQADDPVMVAGKLRNGWPCCQWQRRPSTEPNTFEVTYSWGIAPPSDGVLAAAVLGCQFAMACSTDAEVRAACRLSSKVKSLVRQGVSYEFVTDLAQFAEGRTGLPEVDLWLASLTLGNTRKKPKVINTQTLALQGRARRNGLGPAS